MTTIEEVQLVIDARKAAAGAREFTNATEKVTQSTARADRQLKGLDQKFEATGRSAERSSKGVGLFSSQLGRFLTVAAAIQASRVFVRQAAEYQDIGNKLALVTGSTESAAAAQERLFRIAQNTGQNLGATADIYAKLARSADQYNLSQEQLLTLTERINQTVAVSGAGPDQARAGLLQLGQAIESGRLQGDEFRSISENLPEVLRVIQQRLGVSRAELRELGKEGKLSGDLIIEAFLGASTQAEKFARTSDTIGRSITRVGNSFGNLVDRLSDSGVGSAITSTFNGISAGIDGVADSLETVDRLTKSLFGGGFGFNFVAPGSGQDPISQAGRAAGEILDNVTRDRAFGALEDIRLRQFAREQANAGNEADRIREEQAAARRAAGADAFAQGNTLGQLFSQARTAISDQIALAEILDQQAADERTREAARRLGDDIGFSIADPIGQALLSQFRSLEEFGATLLRNLAAAAVQNAVVGPLASAISGLFAPQPTASANAFPFLSSLANLFRGQGANGALSGPGGASFFASGGTSSPFGKVLDGPTIKRLTSGGLGLFGEAGPAAEFPLTRDRRGRLAVTAVGGGGGGTLNQTFVVQGVSDARTFRRSMRQTRYDQRREAAAR